MLVLRKGTHPEACLSPALGNLRHTGVGGCGHLLPQDPLSPQAQFHHLWWQSMWADTASCCAPTRPSGEAGLDGAFLFSIPAMQGLKDNAEAEWEKSYGDMSTGWGKDRRGMGGSKQQRKESAKRAWAAGLKARRERHPEPLSLAGDVPVALGGGARR